MKKKAGDADELRPEYPEEFFQEMKPNRFAEIAKRLGLRQRKLPLSKAAAPAAARGGSRRRV